MTEPRWPAKESIIVLHDRSLALHGGTPGLRDEGLLESALARAANLFHYDGVEDICTLAATYLVAVASNHPFADGNKRAAFLATGLFMRLNGRRLVAGQAEAARAVFAVAAGERNIGDIAEWLRAHSIAESIPPAPATC